MINEKNEALRQQFFVTKRQLYFNHAHFIKSNLNGF